MKRPFKILIVAGSVILFAHLVSFILDRTNLLEGLNRSFTDFDITDIYYGNGFAYKTAIDTNIVLVNIGTQDRRGIAEMIDRLNTSDPAVMALNILFRSEKDSLDDAALESALSKTNNLVMSLELSRDPETNHFDSISKQSLFRFAQYAAHGFANFNIPDEDKSFGTVRHFNSNYYNYRNSSYYNHFTRQILEQFNPDTERPFTDRQNRRDYIHWSGYWFQPAGQRVLPSPSDNIFIRLFAPDELQSSRFLMLDAEDVLTNNYAPEVVRNRIVLMGYIGENIYENNLDYKYYTPLNPRIFGRSYPDMYGLTIHANILSMMLSGDYIYSRAWLDYGLSFLIFISSVILYLWIYQRSGSKYQLYSKATLIVQLNLIVIIALLLFHFFLIRFDPRWLLFYLLFIPDAIEILESTRWFSGKKNSS